MMKHFYLFFLLFQLLFIPDLLSQQTVNKGIIDLSDKKIDKSYIALDGEWEFYKNELYAPNDFEQNKITEAKFLTVPGLWNKQNIKNSGIGYGTYRLILKNLKQNRIYALNINRIQSSYTIWINGNLLHFEGKPGKSKNETIARWSSKNLFFESPGKETEIIIQVSNYHHHKGGIEHSIYLGGDEIISARSLRLSAISIFLLGVLMIMATYHLGMFIFKSNDKTNLFFALAMIFTGIFSLTVSEILIEKIIPSLNWQVIVKTNYISNYLRLLFFLLFIYYSFRKQFNKTILYILIVAIVLMSLFSIIAPVVIITKTLNIFIVLAAISLIYLIIGQVRAMINKIPGSFYSFLGIFILILSAANDIMLEYKIIKTISLTTFGLFLFIILHSYLISIQNAFSYKSIQKITDNLTLKGVIKDALFTAESYNLNVPLKVISEVTNTDRIIIFILQNNNWIAFNEYHRIHNTFRKLNINVFSGKEDEKFSSSIVKKAISSNTYKFTHINDSVDTLEATYFESNSVKSVFTFPIYKDGLVQAMLYFENYNEKPDFKIKTVEIMESIHAHLSVYSENFDSYSRLRIFNKELEDKVREVNFEIEEKNIQLKELRKEIEYQNEQIENKKAELIKQNQEIKDGIKYATKIHKAFVQSERILQKKFPENFIISKPKDVISGDFFWYGNLNNTESVLIVADSTGFGVPGALMSFIGHEIINNTVNYNKIKSPKLILNTIQNEFRKKISEENDIIGYDMSVVYYNSEKSELLFSGAQNSIFLVKKNNLIEYRATQLSIGHTQMTESQIRKRFFTNNRISVEKGETLYMFTDGFVKQIGEESQRKFMKTRFKNLLAQIHNKSMQEQKIELETIFEKWKGQESQTDDVLILGVKL
jgi:serine phosphatase RsbU (regulator of sigma subunit)